MSVETRIAFHGVDASDALRANVLEHVEHLERFAADIQACNVVIEANERSHRKGNRFNVRIHLVMHGCQIDAGHGPAVDGRREDVYVAVADAFDAVRRQVEDHVRRRRGDVKKHAPRPVRT